MRYAYFATAALLGLTATMALAQAPAGTDPAAAGRMPGTGTSLPRSTGASNIDAADTHGVIAPTLPRSGLGGEATPKDYLREARASLTAGRSGQAQQSLEMAETRALDRSVRQGDTGIASDSPMVSQIRDALHALGHRDSKKAIECIDQALSI